MQEKEKKSGNIWLTVASFVVDKRKAILVLFIFAIIHSVLSVGRTQVNSDLTKYLPEESETRIGLVTMQEEFVTYGMASVMIGNVTYEEALDVVEIIKKVDGVTSVMFDNTEASYVGTNALMTINVDGLDGDVKNIETMNSVKEALAGYDYYINTTIGQNEAMLAQIQSDISVIMVLAVVIIIGVLLFTSTSYAAVMVLMMTFGVAAILNMGTNYLMGEISTVTDSIAVILQLALAIDYAIILLERFLEEKHEMNSEMALKVALSKAIPEISSSSLTTVSGMLALCFMQFRIGADMGRVLIKAILLSLISVFLFMPSLLMIFEKWIDKTMHKSLVPNVSFIGKFANKTKYIIPPIFFVAIIAGCIISGKSRFVYDMNNVESNKKSEATIHREKIESVFGKNNQLVVMVPSGDYKKEAETLARLERLDYVSSALGLANQELMDGIYLTGEITPRELSEMLDMDIEVVQLLYTGYAFEHGEYGPMLMGIDDYGVPLLDMFVFLLEMVDESNINLGNDMGRMMDEMKDMLFAAKDQLQGENYSRFILNLDKPAEGEETYAALEEIREIAEEVYGKDSVILAGGSTSCKDLSDSFVVDNTVITVLTILFVLVILFFTFQSAGLPVLLVATIQGSIWINFSIPVLEGNSMYFIAYLIGTAIQMGACIDYAIVIASRYMDLKTKMPLKDAVGETINQAFPTILTSGSIMASAGFIIGGISSDATTAAMGTVLGRGAVVSIILVVFVLPQILLLGDTIIEKTALNISIDRKEKELVGKIGISGHIRGYVQGEIDADVQGILIGDADISLKAIIPGRDATAEIVDEDGDAIEQAGKEGESNEA
ncbi:MAG: MMPL family transporter [Roseburia sp.]|nr:MMPL family transporter [Roseburia sp.]